MGAKRFDIPNNPEQRIRSIDSCDYARQNGLELISISENEVRVAMDVEGKLNGFKCAHGGAVFALADQAFAFAVNKDDTPQVAMSASIRYVKTAYGRLEAVATKVREDAKTSVVKVLVYDENELVAEFEGVSYKLRKD